MTANIQRKEFDTADDLATCLADEVSEELDYCIKRHGRASIALSGGSTPRRFLSALGQADIDWGKVIVTLVDERWVPPTHKRSNARMLEETLLAGKASAATFIPLYESEIAAEQALAKVTSRLQSSSILPPDVIVLGMGEDGHTASLFPHTTVQYGPDKRLATCEPKGIPETRITMTLETILSAPRIYLHLEGKIKLETLEIAMAGTDVVDMPIRAILHQTRAPVTIFSVF